MNNCQQCSRLYKGSNKNICRYCLIKNNINYSNCIDCGDKKDINILNRRNGICYDCHIHIINTRKEECLRCQLYFSHSTLIKHGGLCGTCHKYLNYSTKINHKLSLTLNKMTPIKYELINHQSCSICLEDWTNDDNLIILSKCYHYYHSKCLDQWSLTGNNECPTCLQTIDH